MTTPQIAQAIFLTNTFAQAHPQDHIRLWNEFLKEVPFKDRSGVYGMDNLAYARWLKKRKDPVLSEFVTNNIDSKSF